jgi:hypothetical protein
VERALARGETIESIERRAQQILVRLTNEKLLGTRPLPSSTLISIGNHPALPTRRFLLDACARLVDRDLFGRSELCVQFAILLRSALKTLGDRASVERGVASYRGSRSMFEWRHAWVRTAGGDIVDGNIDSIVENPYVPDDVRPHPYWGPAASTPSDRTLLKESELLPADEPSEPDWNNLFAWKRELKTQIRDWKSRQSAATSRRPKGSE